MTATGLRLPARASAQPAPAPLPLPPRRPPQRLPAPAPAERLLLRDAGGRLLISEPSEAGTGQVRDIWFTECDGLILPADFDQPGPDERL